VNTFLANSERSQKCERGTQECVRYEASSLPLVGRRPMITPRSVPLERLLNETMLLRLVRRLHTYAGLLTFVHLAVYGIVGLTIPFSRQSPVKASVVRYRSFTVPPNLTDRQVAGRICSWLGLSLATPVNSAAIQHDAANNLFLDFWHANGRDQVTVLEKEGRLRIETTPNSLPLYLFTLHETTAAFHSGDWRMQLWADYNEFALWCLLGMIASGFAMFLAARWRSRLALISLVAGCCLFCALYFFTR
jgi:hypothetical protein